MFVLVRRVAWFQEAIAEKSQPLTEEEVHAFVERYWSHLRNPRISANLFRYIAREDEAVAELKEQQRPGRPKTKDQEQIEARIDTEQKEYQSGLWIPDLCDPDSTDKLQRWGGRWGGLNTLKFVRVIKGPPNEIKASSFPPKGLS